MGAGNRMTVTTDSGQLIGMRPYRLDDAEHMVDGMQSYSVVRTLGRVFAPSLEAERTWIAERAADPTGFGWARALRIVAAQPGRSSMTRHNGARALPALPHEPRSILR